MSLLFSAPDGYASLRFRGLLLGLIIAWLLPSSVAAMALAVQWLLGTPAMGDGFLMLWAGSYLLLISPALSWLGLVLAAPLVAILMDRGWFGWIPALMLGILCGGVTAVLMGHVVAVSFGAALLVILRGVLGRICPQAFDLSVV
jgi:hypothetical protein